MPPSSDEQLSVDGRTSDDATVSDWARLHDAAAREYKLSEWTREVVFGVRAKRDSLFRLARGKVLDVACGYGSNFPFLPNATHISGVDISPVMLAMAKEQVGALGRPVELSEGVAEALKFPDDSFDTVISALSTCSFLDPIASLREMRRVCKPDGRILLIEHGRSRVGWIGWLQDRTAPGMLKTAGCRWNQEPQDLIRQAGLSIKRAERSFLGVFHTIEASPAKG